MPSPSPTLRYPFYRTFLLIAFTVLLYCRITTSATIHQSRHPRQTAAADQQEGLTLEEGERPVTIRLSSLLRNPRHMVWLSESPDFANKAMNQIKAYHDLFDSDDILEKRTIDSEETK